MAGLPGYKLVDRKKRSYRAPDGKIISGYEYNKRRSGVAPKKRMLLYETDTFGRWESRFKRKRRAFEPYSEQERLINELAEIEEAYPYEEPGKGEYPERPPDIERRRTELRIQLFHELGIHEPWMSEALNK